MKKKDEQQVWNIVWAVSEIRNNVSFMLSMNVQNECACVCVCVRTGVCTCVRKCRHVYVYMLSTTHLILLNQFGQHDNDGCMVFPHHLPEVSQCVWGGAWGRGMQERTLNP